MYSDELSDVLRMAVQPMTRFRQFCDAKDATKKGLNRGDQFTWNVYSDVATQGTTLNENTAMPETNFTITQGSLTVEEYGNSVPYTGKLDNLSKHPVSEIIHKALNNDANKALETAAHAQFDLSPLSAVGTSATAITFDYDGTVSTNNASAMTDDHVKLIVDEMKERNIPVYDGRDYFAIGKPSAYRRLKNDIEAVHSYVSEGFQRIMAGEVGRHYEGVRFIEQTFIDETAGDWDAGSNVSSDVYFFGEDTVAEAIVIPEEIRGKIPTDFGRSKGVAWYYLGGFGLVHTLAMGAAQARIMKWDSAT
jgi:N4-gp56 family major capsid protein